AATFGMRVVRAAEPVHGKPATILHDGRTLFEDLPSPFRAARYHSLIVPEEDVADARDGHGRWEVSARTPDGVVMGLRRVWSDPRRAPIEGVQFHPESYLTDHGVALLANFLRGAGAPARAPARAPALAAADTIAAR